MRSTYHNDSDLTGLDNATVVLGGSQAQEERSRRWPAVLQ